MNNDYLNTDPYQDKESIKEQIENLKLMISMYANDDAPKIQVCIQILEDRLASLE